MNDREPGAALPSVTEPLLARLDDIAATVAAQCVAQTPAYQLLPASVAEGDLVANLRATMDIFLTTLAEHRAPSKQELAQLVSWGAERARDGMPLDAVLRIYPLSSREILTIILAAAAPHQHAEVAQLAVSVLDFLSTVQPQVATTYLEERDSLDWEHREHRQQLAGALLAGLPAERLAARSGRTLAERYCVVAFRIPDLPAGDDTRGATKLFRAIQDQLDTDHDVLATFERDGGILLIPAPAPDDRDRAARARLRDILTHVDTATGTRCTAGAATAATHADIPRAHQHASDLLNLAATLRRPPGPYWLTDLATDYQLAQPSPARDHLASTLAPLEPHPHLLDALRTFIATGYQRGDAATALTIHRNTLNYRLHRIHTLTGHNPTDPTDARHLAAALTAYDTTHHDHPGT